jgi:DNA-binding GntR family transcriptional regulator
VATPRQNRLAPAAVDSLVQVAYDAIRESILDGRFAMGEHIIEKRVSEDLDTSRAPVREALRRLQQEGLVVEKPRRGTFVREISGADFVDIYNVRIAIECAAAQLIVRRRPPLKSVERLVAKMEQAAGRGQVGKTVDLELQVHQHLCDIAGNQYLAGVFRSLAGPVRMALGLDDAAYADLEQVAAEYRPLLDALGSDDPERAARAMHHHIVASVEPVLARLGGDAGDLFTAPPIVGAAW